MNINPEMRSEKGQLVFSSTYRRFHTERCKCDWFDLLGSLLTGIGPLVNSVIDIVFLDGDSEDLDRFPWIQSSQMFSKFSLQFPSIHVKVIGLRCVFGDVLEPFGGLSSDLIIPDRGFLQSVRLRKLTR